MKETITIPLAHYEQLFDILDDIRKVIIDPANEGDQIEDHFDDNTIDQSILYEMQTNIVVNRITNGK